MITISVIRLISGVHILKCHQLVNIINFRKFFKDLLAFFEPAAKRVCFYYLVIAIRYSFSQSDHITQLLLYFYYKLCHLVCISNYNTNLNAKCHARGQILFLDSQLITTLFDKISFAILSYELCC
jgi:hypothetical protein